MGLSESEFEKLRERCNTSVLAGTTHFLRERHSHTKLFMGTLFPRVPAPPHPC